MAQPVIIISSPTASGKTAVSLRIANLIPVEIISADSRQIYKYLNIGTAKPEQRELRQVPHHFIDELEPAHSWNAGEFSKKARKLLPEILKRDSAPLVTGGTGLYVKAFIDGIAGIPGKDENIRKELQNLLNEKGLESLIRELKIADPEGAKEIDLRNPRRVLRAVELYRMTGMTRRELSSCSGDPLPYPVLWFGLRWDRRKLYERIDLRVDRMIERGLVEEVRKISEMGYDKNLNSLMTVGYSEVFDFLEGKMSLDEMRELIRRNTRRFAKRQLTWFNKEKRIEWIDILNEADLEYAANYISNKYENHNRAV